MSMQKNKAIFPNKTSVINNIYSLYIEASLDVYGTVSPKDLIEKFKIQRAKASNVIKQYRSNADTSKNIEYVPKGKLSHYKKTIGFQNVLVRDFTSSAYIASIEIVFSKSGCSFQQICLKYIDSMLEIYSLVSPSDLSQQFKMHRTRASEIMKIYRESRESASNARYHLEGQRACYLRTYTFRRAYLPDSQSALGFLSAIDLLFHDNLSADKDCN